MEELETFLEYELPRTHIKGDLDKWVAIKISECVTHYNVDKILNHKLTVNDELVNLRINLLTKVLHWRDGKPSKERMELLRQYEETNS